MIEEQNGLVWGCLLNPNFKVFFIPLFKTKTGTKLSFGMQLYIDSTKIIKENRLL